MDPYFTPTQERIAIVETASYNQKLLALRARRIAQQRMNYAHEIASYKQETEEQSNNDNASYYYVGDPPQITELSDDEDCQMEETFAPVPYQRAYWLAAQRQSQKNKTSSNKINNNKTLKNNNNNYTKQIKPSSLQKGNVHTTTSAINKRNNNNNNMIKPNTNNTNRMDNHTSNKKQMAHTIVPVKSGPPQLQSVQNIQSKNTLKRTSHYQYQYHGHGQFPRRKNVPQRSHYQPSPHNTAYAPYKNTKKVNKQKSGPPALI